MWYVCCWRGWHVYYVLRFPVRTYPGIYGRLIQSANHVELLSFLSPSLQAAHSQEKYKFENTIGQQSKLIDYLQNKVENTSPKKKKGVSDSVSQCIK